MENMLDYLRWRGDIPFSSSPFNEVDNIICSMLSFIDFSGIVTPDALARPIRLSECLEDHAKRYPNGQNFGAIIPKENNDLLSLAAKSVRFGDTYVLAYRDEIDEKTVKQFAAVTFVLPDNSLFVAFRGTDDTFVGWKEDLAMSYDYPTESQRAAVGYLSEIAKHHSGAIRLGGHSKGGNIAAYAAVFTTDEIRERIVTAYNNDGPGFMDDTLASAEYAAARDKIYTIVPQGSLVSQLFGITSNVHVIESTNKGGAAQHNPYSWTVSGTKFSHLPALSEEARRNHAVFVQWIDGTSADERRLFSNAIFSTLDDAGVHTITEFTENKLHCIAAIMKSVAAFDKETKDTALMFIRRFIDALKG